MDLLHDIARIIAAIPATFWGVVAGSFFALCGVSLTNRANYHRLKEQFEHERSQRIADNEYLLRKEAFISTAEMLSAGIQVIGRFINMEIPDAAVTDPYVEKAQITARLQIIAGNDVLEKVGVTTNKLTEVCTKLFLARFEVRKLKNEVEIINNFLEQFQRESDKALEMMKQYNLEQKQDPTLWKTLDNNFQFEHKRVIEHIEKLNNHNKKYLECYLTFINECTKEVAPLAELVAAVFLAFRKELRIPINEAEYLEEIRATMMAQTETMERFMAGIAEKLNQISEDDTPTKT